jgi:hypothetical protein
MNVPRKTSSRMISELEDLIRGLHAVTPDMGVERCRTLVETLGQREEIMSLIGSVLSDSELLEDVASRSYPHVNKFDKIVLVGSGEPSGYRLTLHLWRPPYLKETFGRETIHGHRFSFWSAIVAGLLSSELFEEREASPASGDDISVFHKYKYVPETNRTAKFRDFYEFQDRVSLARVGVSQKGAGDSYYLDTSAIHRVILPRRITCSLVLRGPRVSEYSYVYNIGYPQNRIYLKNKMFSPGELETRLDRLMSTLRGG